MSNLERRDERMTIRLTATEKRAIVVAARRRDGTDPGVYARNLILDGLARDHMEQQ